MNSKTPRARTPGPARPAGSKLAKKALRTQLTVRAFGRFGVINK